MPRRYFTAEQAERMIPRLERAFGRMLQLRVQVRPVLERLHAAGHAPSGRSFELHPAGVEPEVIDDLTTLEALVRALEDQLRELFELGCLVKSIDRGLVDFYTRSNGHTILLTWRLGEKRVAHWRELGAALDVRWPLADLPDPD